MKENKLLKNTNAHSRSPSAVPASECDSDSFEKIWAEYPKRPGASKSASLKAYKARLKAGDTKDQIMAGVKAYAVPYNEHTLVRLREMGLVVDDIVAVEINKPRNGEFWGLAHRLGNLCTEHVEDFSGQSAHEALKKLQLDSKTKCDTSSVDLPGFGRVICHKPRSLSFDSMDQTQFFEVMKSFCRHISQTYWPNMTANQIASMAGCMTEER